LTDDDSISILTWTFSYSKIVVKFYADKPKFELNYKILAAKNGTGEEAKHFKINIPLYTI
jgi:hypothetical protein